MPLKLMYITNQENIARIADNNGVDWIFVDLEINGKEKRQGHLDTVISRHSINDVKKIKRVLNHSKLIVRVNPIFDFSKEEIDEVVKNGADIIMLPFFTTKDEVALFISYVNNRCKTCLLLETPLALLNIDSILSIKGIDYIHIGLNDLHLGLKRNFMFELLADGTIETICNKLKYSGIPYGFGGIARLGEGRLPAEHILAEHYRLGSSLVILSRSFCNINDTNDLNYINEIFNSEIGKIRNFEKELLDKTDDFYKKNKLNIVAEVMEIVNSLQINK